MRVICIFKGTKLVEQSNTLPLDKVEQFRSNVAFQLGVLPEELDAIKFEDSDIDAYMQDHKSSSRKVASISKSEMTLIDMVETTVPTQVRLSWRNCDQAQLEANFSLDDRQKIAQNIEYYNSIGAERFQPGFTFNWPHEVIGPMVDAEKTVMVESVFKTIPAIVL